jgi:hypothetical protein
VSIRAGERLTVKGKGARECCVLLEGAAEVYAGGEVVAVLRAGSLVGELSLLTNRPRSATVVARTRLRAIVFDGAAFTTMLATVPSAARQILAGSTADVRVAPGVPTGSSPQPAPIDEFEIAAGSNARARTHSGASGSRKSRLLAAVLIVASLVFPVSTAAAADPAEPGGYAVEAEGSHTVNRLQKNGF